MCWRRWPGRGAAGLPGATCWLTGRNATGRTADWLPAVPGTIARRTRPDPVAANGDRAGADPWPVAGTLPVTVPDDAGMLPFDTADALTPLVTGTLRYPLAVEAAWLGERRSSRPEAGRSPAATAGGPVPTELGRGAPVGGAMVRLAIPVAGVSVSAGLAVASPRTGCAPPARLAVARAPAPAASPARTEVGCVAGAPGRDAARPAPLTTGADQPGRTGCPARTAGRSCAERWITEGRLRPFEANALEARTDGIDASATWPDIRWPAGWPAKATRGSDW
jgi:hypothetical protein